MSKQNFNEKLIALLKTDPDFVDESDELLPAAVKDHAWQLDHNLIKLLLSDPEIKTTFFDEIDGHWVFNHNTFIDYITAKNFLANSYTQFRNKIGLNIDGKYLRERGEVSLVWPYKDCVLEGGQIKEEEKRNWYVNAENPEKSEEAKGSAEEAEAYFMSIDSLDAQKHLLAKLLDKNQLYVNLSEIEDADFGVSVEDKALNKMFYGNSYKKVKSDE
ncbi:MAG: site-specific DNA-methyltransferase [Candidatus Poribacteria bacterium]|nr:site-specific DNA-methyltransferase [Candidatus Poribacteria bacterium]